MAAGNGAVSAPARKPLVKIGGQQARSDEPIARVFGKLVGFEVRDFEDKERPGRVNFKHELLLEYGGSRQWKCVAWEDRVIDISALEGEPVEFDVYYFRPDDYGRSAWKDAPKVLVMGHLPEEYREVYAKKA